MRVLTLNANLKGVGTYGRCFYFSRELARAGHDVTMATVSRVSRFKPRTYFKRDWLGEYGEAKGAGPWIRMFEGANLGYKWLPGWGSGPLDIIFRTKELAFHRYDIVYGFEYQPNVSWPVYLTRPFANYQYFSDWCDWYAGASNHLRGYRWAHRLDAIFEERIRRLAQRVTVISQVLLHRATSLGIPCERVLHIRQGVDTEYMRVFPQRSTRRRLRLPTDRPIIVAVNDGDMQRMVRVFAKVREQVPKALAIIIGAVDTASRMAAQEMGGSDCFVFPGYVSDDDYPQYLNAADLGLLPLSDVLLNHARFPGKLLDMAAAGIPVVTNRVGEPGAFVQQNGIGAAVGQPEDELASAAISLLKDDDQRRWLGQRAREITLQDWDWRLRGPQICSVIEASA